MEDLKFPRELIKGKIAEIVFEQMFRGSKKFTILRSGYEYTLSVLAQYQQLPRVEEYLKSIRRTPDFILITEDKKQAYIVEVKYRTHIKFDKIKKIASDNKKIWDPSFLFVASPVGFFFDSCSEILRNDGEISPLNKSWINKETQNNYLKLMNEFRLGRNDD